MTTPDTQSSATEQARQPSRVPQAGFVPFSVVLLLCIRFAQKGFGAFFSYVCASQGTREG